MSTAARTNSPPERPADRVLVWLLRLGGVTTLCAFFAVFLPADWMVRTHHWLGLGDFPRAPITLYLARSVSAMYAIHGLLLLALAQDVERYRPAIRILGIGTTVLGAVLLGIDWSVGMPWWWTALEGPPVAMIGLALAGLAKPRHAN